MTRESSRFDLADLVAGFAEDVFEYDDAQVDADLVDAGENPEDVARRMRSAIGRALLQDARTQINTENRTQAHREGEGAVLAFAPGVARAKLAEIVGRDPAAHPELTMAARKGAFLSDKDAESQLEDLIELGVVSREDLE